MCVSVCENALLVAIEDVKSLGQGEIEYNLHSIEDKTLSKSLQSLVKVREQFMKKDWLRNNFFMKLSR